MKQGAKVRSVDDLTRSGVNGRAIVHEKIKLETLDYLAKFHDLIQQETPECSVTLLKADVAAAFRSLSILPGHQELTRAAFMINETQRIVIRHDRCPLGAVGSVFGWHKAGQIINAIIRVGLLAMSAMYVDDIFGIESIGSAKHLLRATKTVVTAFGWSLDDNKMQVG